MVSTIEPKICLPLTPLSSAPANLSLSTARPSGSCVRPDATCPNTARSVSSILCSKSARSPALAAEVTITAAEFLGVDAAIIFADLLLPLEVMGLPFHFSAGEGPVIERPVRTKEDIAQLRTDRSAELGYVSEAVSLVAKHFAGKIPVIGFCGAPFTLASYMIEGGGSRNYVHAKKMMYNSPTRLGCADAQIGRGHRRIFHRTGPRRSRRHPDFRQLGGLPQRGRLSPLRSAPRHWLGEAFAENRRSHHLFRHRQLHACFPR